MSDTNNTNTTPEPAKKREFPWHRIKPYKMTAILRPLIRCICWLVFPMQVTGRENVPKKTGGVIIACNHMHAIDPVFLEIASRKDWRFMAKIELFRNKYVAFFLRHGNSFPVDRETIDRNALDYSVKVLEDGRCGLGIFPEGTRSPDGVPKEGKSGVAAIARKSKADILPCSIYYEGSLKPRKKITIRFGEVIPFAALELGETPNKRKNTEATAKIMAEIMKLWEQRHG